MVYIKSMICQGFKSFKEPTRINFDKGFSAIVGANGSGKSNILDAFVFALGELSGKMMRVNNVRDLICNGGSDDKNPSRIARVDIIFDNSDGQIPIVSKEVMISRKINIKGNGAYYINGRRTTRRELQDLMDLCNLIPNSTNLVLQGELFRTINMSNTERRQIIDEISGIASYNEKKENAEKQLEKIEENISRITLLLNEVSLQLDNLEAEKNDALEYQRLDGLQKNTEKALLILKIESIRKSIVKLEENKKNIVEEIKQIEDLIFDKRSSLSDLNERLNSVDNKIKNLETEELLELTKKLNELKTEKAKSETSQEHLNKEIGRIKKEQIKIINKKAELKQEKAELANQLSQLKQEKSAKENELELNNGKFNSLKQQLQELDSGFLELQQNLECMRGILLNEQEDKNQIYSEIKVLENKKENYESNSKNISEKIHKLGNDIEEIKSKITQLEDKKQEFQEHNISQLDINNLESNKVQLDKELKKLQEIIQDKHEKLISLKSKVKTIKNINQNRAIEAILNLKATNELNGEIYGTIQQLGQADSKYNVALEVAGGGKLNYIVVDSQKTAKECIQHLKRNKLGRASFIPLDKIKVNVPNFSISFNESVVGRAVDLIRFDSCYLKAFEFVFGKTIIVKDMDTAVKLPINARKVTLNGDVVESSNLMRGGSYKKNSGFSFKTIEESEIPVCESDLNKLKDKENSLIKSIKEIDLKIAQFYKNRIQGSSDLNDITQKLNGLRERKNEKESELKSLESEQEKLKVDMHQNQELLDKKQDLLTIASSKIAELKAQEAKIQAEIQNSENSKIKEELELIEKEINRIKDNITQIELKSAKLKTKLDDVIDNQIKEIEETIANNEETIKSYLEEVQSLENSLEKISAELQEISEKILEKNEILGEFITEKNRITKEITDTRISIEEMKSSLNPKSLQVNTIENKLDTLNEQLSELELDYGPDFDQTFNADELNIPVEIKVLMSVSQQKLEETIADCIEKKILLEPLNMRAIDKYDKIKNRYDDLIEKHEQVTKERQSIIDFIEQIEAEKKEVFMKTFNGINENFAEIFSKLSPHGEAKLELENQEDPFAGGLKILARPGGKKWCLTQSMSGGEKTLTIIALILGIQQYVPSPYYILDEIDAALDEVNTILVADMVKELSLKSQFILITHREQTMEKTDQLLGVSIADGLSFVLNINIKEALAQIAE